MFYQLKTKTTLTSCKQRPFKIKLENVVFKIIYVILLWFFQTYIAEVLYFTEYTETYQQYCFEIRQSFLQSWQLWRRNKQFSFGTNKAVQN